MAEGAGFGIGVKADAQVVRLGGMRPLGAGPVIKADVRCVAPDGTERWRDECVFFDPTTTFLVDAGATPAEGDDDGKAQSGA